MFYFLCSLTVRIVFKVGTVLPVFCTPLGAGHFSCAAYNRVAGPILDASGLAAALLPEDTGKRAVKAARFKACFGALHACYSAVPSSEPSAFRLIGSIGNLGRFKFQNRGSFWTTDPACFQRGPRRCVGRIGTRSIGERLSYGWRSSSLWRQTFKWFCICHTRSTNAEPYFNGLIGVVFHQEFFKKLTFSINCRLNFAIAGVR